MSSNPLLNASLMQLFHAPGMGSNPLMPNMQMFSPGLGMNAPMPQQQMPQQPMQQMPPQMQEVEQALMSGMGTPGMQAMGAFEEGVAPFEQQWANTQNRRFTRGGLGLGETIYDMIREKKLSPQRQAVDAQRARMAQEEALKQADQKYKDAKEIIGGRNSNLSPGELDAMARRYAQGEDLNKLAQDTSITPYQQAQLDMKQRDYAYQQNRALIESNQGLAAEKKSEAVDLSKRIEPSLGRYSKAQEVQGRLLSVVDDYQNSSAPVDIQVMYDFIKSIDPDSVVREGEVRLTESGMGYQTLVTNALEKFKQDQVVPADFMAGLANQAMQINEGLQESARRDLGRYYNMARNNGYDMMDVFGNESLTEAARGAAEHNYALREAAVISGEDIRASRGGGDQIRRPDLSDDPEEEGFQYMGPTG